MSSARDPGIDLDLMAAAAQTRLAAFINRTAAHQMRRMREGWAEAAEANAISRSATPQPAESLPMALPFRYTDEPTYLRDAITALDDEFDDLTTFDLMGTALQVATGAALIFCTGFGLGYLTGAR